MTDTDTSPGISLKSLFWEFLKIGSYSFGGYVALVAVVEKELVQRKKVISEDNLLEGLTLASFLPGPVAVNTVVYVGHFLHGVKGALISMTAILIPTFLLVIGFSHFYFQEGNANFLDPYVSFIMPVILAIIVDVAFRMSRKQIKQISQVLIAIGTITITLYWQSAWAIIVSLVLAGLTGSILYGKRSTDTSNKQIALSPLLSDLKAIIIATAITVVLLVCLGFLSNSNLTTLAEIASVFSGISLTLFGGGYVIIPIIEQVLVNDLSWLNIDEFNAAISISQVTPGPILISAAFIGYKLAGVPGALMGTVCIFFPTGMLMILLSGFHQSIKKSGLLQGIIKGLKAAVIGLIVVAAFSIGSKEIDSWISAVIFAVSLTCFTFTKIHPIVVILATLMLGLIII